MKTKFTPIAMRCNQEQFEAIKPKLEKAGIKITSVTYFSVNNYLTNNWNEDCPVVANHQDIHSNYSKCKQYEYWNEKTFLRACGIEVKPSLEEVKAYFKNAKEVICLNGKKDIGTPDFEKMYFTKDGAVVQNPWDKNWLVLYEPKKGYAEIISYKDEPLTVSKEFILDLHNDVIWPSVKAKIEK
jgi:hypothetical protein